LYALANEEGEALARSFDWQALRRQELFTTVAQADQTAAIPNDVQRFVRNSFYNRTTVRPMLGPITPQEWQAVQALPAIYSMYLAYIERDGKFLITPTPPADQTIAYEYISTNWAKSSTGTPQDQFLADDDTTYLDEYLIRLGLRWRYLQAKGLDYAEAMRTYELELQKQEGRDGGATIVSAYTTDAWPMPPNIPPGNWPSA
jgi:hypothetical protein